MLYLTLSIKTHISYLDKLNANCIVEFCVLKTFFVYFTMVDY